MPVEMSDIQGPVLVIAPHPDDETLGCGGIIAALSDRGETVHTVFVTDGGASHRSSKTWDRSRLSAVREDEAREALRHLGAEMQPRTHLRLPDAAMPHSGCAAYEASLAQLESILITLCPRTVLVPWRRDPHCDHRDAWALTMAALEQTRQQPLVLEYAIWLDELGAPDDHPRAGEMDRVAIDAQPYMERKRTAIRAHRSQLGLLVHDDPDGFVLTESTIARLIGSEEVYWRACPVKP